MGDGGNGEDVLGDADERRRLEEARNIEAEHGLSSRACPLIMMPEGQLLCGMGQCQWWVEEAKRCSMEVLGRGVWAIADMLRESSAIVVGSGVKGVRRP